MNNSAWSTAHSTLRSSWVSAYVEANYKLINPTAHQAYIGVNDTYIIETRCKRTAVLRVYRRDRSHEDISYEIKLLRELANVGLCVGEPIPDVCGRYVRAVDCPEGTRLIVLFTFCIGRPLPNDTRLNSQLGEYAAHMHLAMDSENVVSLAKPEGRRHIQLSEYLETACKAIVNATPGRPLVGATTAKFVEAISRDFETNYANSLNIGVCHGDFHAGNLVVSSGAFCLFDFDFCNTSWRAADIATYVWHRMAEPLYPVTTAGLVEGYRRVRTFSEAEEKAIPILVLARVIWFRGFQAQEAARDRGMPRDDDYWVNYLRVLARWDRAHTHFVY